MLRRPVEFALRTLVGVEDDPVHVASPNGSGHDQGPGGQLGVVMGADGEADEATGGQVLDGGQVELALLGGDLGQVPAPLLVDLGGAEVPFEQVDDGQSCLVGPGE